MVRMLSDKADLAVSCVHLPAAAQVPDAKWEPFQLHLLNNEDRFGIDIKARQIAWSFTAALDAICDGLLHPNTPHTFISINQDEATEKIRYANAILDAWHAPQGYPKVKVIRSNSYLIELSNGSRLISFPCRPPRGMARNRIYLDEIAHYRSGLDQEIHTAALPATVKGDGYIRMGSSPLGAGGLFWEVATESLKTYPGYAQHRRYIPWWKVRYLCQDPGAAKTVAPEMPTEHRVEQFGTPALVEIYRNMFLEDFRQEYECYWADETVAWHPWEIIQRNQKEDHLWFSARGVDDALLMLPKVQEAIAEGKIEGVLFGGVDIGRVHDLTELILVGKTTTDQLPLRVRVSLHGVEHPDQEACVIQYLQSLPVTMTLIDDSGMGGPLAEKAIRAVHKVQGVTFTNANKETWAVETRRRLTESEVPLPIERDLAYQIHSIKKRVTATKTYAFDAERNEQGHADAYWAWALAIWAGKSHRFGTGVVI